MRLESYLIITAIAALVTFIIEQPKKPKDKRTSRHIKKLNPIYRPPVDRCTRYVSEIRN